MRNRETSEPNHGEFEPMKTKKVETVLVVGGGSGMGRAVATELCTQGMRVFVADLNQATAEETAQASTCTNGPAEAFQVDVSSSTSVSSLYKRLHEKTERLDLLVHTAGILGRTVFIEDMSDEEWRQMITINLDGVFFCCREAVRWMKAHQTGRIILFNCLILTVPLSSTVSSMMMADMWSPFHKIRSRWIDPCA